jgi:protein-S-isoprenylcysteine O-methyltransferase Ste14
LEDGKKAFFAVDTSPGLQNWIMQLILTTPLRVIVAIIPALIWRLLDEKKFLARNLPGYVEYQHRVRYRLIPLVW